MKNQKIIKICKQKLIFLNYSKNTQKTYIHYISEFISKIEKQYAHLNTNDIQHYIDNYTFTSTSQQNQIISSLKFMWKKGLGKKYLKVNFNRPRKEKKLPRVIDVEETRRKILAIENKKHKCILSLALSCGLRVSEVVNLKIKNIDSKRMLIHIKNAKGKKDRIVPLSDKLLSLLREYYSEFNPKEYLFNGQFSLVYSPTSCNKLVKKYIGKDCHFHILRHTALTSMLENGTDIRYIQSIAGHNNINTTTIYTHVSTAHLNKVKTAI